MPETPGSLHLLPPQYLPPTSVYQGQRPKHNQTGPHPALESRHNWQHILESMCPQAVSWARSGGVEWLDHPGALRQPRIPILQAPLCLLLGCSGWLIQSHKDRPALTGTPGHPLHEYKRPPQRPVTMRALAECMAYRKAAATPEKSQML